MDGIFKFLFLFENCGILIRILPLVILRSFFNNNAELVQIMV